MKRFTDTEKWSDPWFQDLPSKFKLFWLLICDRCDNAGVWKPNFKLACFLIGEPLAMDECLELFKDRILVLPNGNWWIRKFIRFQYGKLSHACKPHIPVIAALSNHGIDINDVEQNYERLSKAIGKVIEDYPKGYQSLEEKEKDQEKEKDKTKTGGVGETEPAKPATAQERPPAPELGYEKATFAPKPAASWLSDIAELKHALSQMFKRPNGFSWTCEEEQALAGIARRSNWQDELEELRLFRQRMRDPQFFPKSVMGLVGKWTSTLDMSKCPDQPRKPRQQAL